MQDKAVLIRRTTRPIRLFFFFFLLKFGEGKFKKRLGDYGPKKGEGRCSSVPAKFTVIEKFLVCGEGTEGKEGQDGKGGRGKAPVTRL